MNLVKAKVAHPPVVGQVLEEHDPLASGSGVVGSNK